MYQIGSEALLNAIRTYDETKGKLSTNCYTAIVNRLKHMDIYIDNISISPCSKAIEIKNYIIKNKDMSYDEMFRNCDIACSRSDFNNIATMLNQDSLDDVFPLTSETKGNSVVDNNANVEKDIEDEESKNELVSNIKKNISRYSDNTQKIYMTWLKSKEDDIDITYKVIGDMYGVSKQRVDQVIKMVNKKLQEKLNY